MKQVAQSFRTGKLSLAEVAAPTRAPHGHVLVDTSASLLSAGTERSLVQLARKSLVEKARERPDLVAKVVDKARREGVLAALSAVQSRLDSPVPLGYSLAGRVREVGSGVSDFARGDRVACAGAGLANHAEVNVIPTNLAVHVPEAVSDEEAAFVTVGAIALHGVPELVELFNGRGKVGVAEQSPIAARFEHPVADGVAFAAIAGIAQQPNTGIGFGKVFRDGGRLVLRSVVHDENFVERAWMAAEVIFHGAKGFRQAGLFVVRRNDQ